MKISNETYLHFSEMSIYFKYKLHRGNFRVYRQLFWARGGMDMLEQTLIEKPHIEQPHMRQHKNSISAQAVLNGGDQRN